MCVCVGGGTYNKMFFNAGFLYNFYILIETEISLMSHEVKILWKIWIKNYILYVLIHVKGARRLEEGLKAAKDPQRLIVAAGCVALDVGLRLHALLLGPFGIFDLICASVENHKNLKSKAGKLLRDVAAMLDCVINGEI